jgi:hypothetical protein
MDAQFDWTAAAVETLKQLRDARWSCGEIAAHFGLSRGAVSGKLWRLGGQTARPRPRVRVKVVKRPPAAIVCEAPPEGAVDFLDLEDGHCRYPYGGGPFTFCGMPRRDGSSYCAAHFLLVYTPKGRVVMEKHHV